MLRAAGAIDATANDDDVEP